MATQFVMGDVGGLVANGGCCCPGCCDDGGNCLYQGDYEVEICGVTYTLVNSGCACGGASFPLDIVADCGFGGSACSPSSSGASISLFCHVPGGGVSPQCDAASRRPRISVGYICDESTSSCTRVGYYYWDATTPWDCCGGNIFTYVGSCTYNLFPQFCGPALLPDPLCGVCGGVVGSIPTTITVTPISSDQDAIWTYGIAFGIPVSGTYTLSVIKQLGGSTLYGPTSAISILDNAAQVQTALEGIVGAGNVSVSGGPLLLADFTVAFSNDLGAACIAFSGDFSGVTCVGTCTFVFVNTQRGMRGCAGL